MTAPEDKRGQPRNGKWQISDHVAPDKPFPEPDYAQDRPKSAAERAIESPAITDVIACARQEGIEEGRAQIWDRLAWLVPAVAVGAGLIGYLIGRYWP